MSMRFRPFLVVASALTLAACQTSRNVAVTTWRVIDAPARFVRNRIDPEPRRTTTTTQTNTVYSDTGPAGHPVAATTPRPRATPVKRVSATTSTATSSESTPRREALARPAAPEQTAAPPAPTQQDFPVAKSVPGKPGYVYSPFDSAGAMIDVSGYQSGTKVKDPDTKKIFVVP